MIISYQPPVTPTFTLAHLCPLVLLTICPFHLAISSIITAKVHESAVANNDIQQRITTRSSCGRIMRHDKRDDIAVGDYDDDDGMSQPEG